MKLNSDLNPCIYLPWSAYLYIEELTYTCSQETFCCRCFMHFPATPSTSPLHHIDCRDPASPPHFKRSDLTSCTSHLQGSMNMSYDSSNLTTPDIKWLGVRPSDLDRFNIPDQC
eukprot:scaffold141758_cov21-Tisochrysis_lutea.AAC.1